MGRAKKYSEEDILKMREMYESGMTFTEIGNVFGAGKRGHYVSRLLNSLEGFESRGVKPYNIDVWAVVKKIEEGMTVHQAAILFGVGDHTIYEMFNRHHISVKLIKVPVDYDWVIARYKQGESIAKIAEEMGISDNCLRTRLRSAGYSLADLQEERKRVANAQYEKLVLLNNFTHPNNIHDIRCRGCRIKRGCSECWYRRIYEIGGKK